MPCPHCGAKDDETRTIVPGVQLTTFRCGSWQKRGFGGLPGGYTDIYLSPSCKMQALLIHSETTEAWAREVVGHFHAAYLHDGPLPASTLGLKIGGDYHDLTVPVACLFRALAEPETGDPATREARIIARALALIPKSVPDQAECERLIRGFKFANFRPQ